MKCKQGCNCKRYEISLLEAMTNDPFAWMLWVRDHAESHKQKPKRNRFFYRLSMWHFRFFEADDYLNRNMDIIAEIEKFVVE